MNEGLDRLVEIVADEIGVPADGLSANSGPMSGEIESWDSFSHVTLMLRIENEFGVKFTTEEIGGLVTLQQIADALEKKGAW